MRALLVHRSPFTLQGMANIYHGEGRLREQQTRVAIRNLWDIAGDIPGLAQLSQLDSMFRARPRFLVLLPNVGLGGGAGSHPRTLSTTPVPKQGVKVTAW